MSVVLARVLTASELGIVSIGLVFVSLFTTLHDFGVYSAVVQRDTRIEESIGVAITLRWIIASICLVGVISVAPFLASLYNEPRLALVLVVLSVNLFIQLISFSSFVLLTRSLKFGQLGMCNIVQSVTNVGVTVSLAYLHFSYWSIVYGSLAASAAYVTALRYFENTVVKPQFDWKLARELLGFGSHLLVVGLMGFVIFSVDQLLVGTILSLAVLGVYYVAIKFGRTLSSQISGVVNAVLFPTMARIKDVRHKLMIGYTQSLRMIAIVNVPIAVGLAALSPMFVTVMLSSKWSAAVIPIAILAIQGFLNSIISPASNVLVSIGKPHYMSAQATVQAVVLVAGIYPAARLFGLNGVCAFTTLISLGVFLYFTIVFSRVFEASVREITGPIIPPIVSGLVLFAFLYLAQPMLTARWFSLILLAVVGLAVYATCLHVTSQGRDVRDFFGLVRTMLSR